MEKPVEKKVRSPFPSLYWLVIVFEFFERGSYYGMMSFLSVYFTDVLFYSKESVGVIKSVIQPLLYFIPILSGALADRFGYRRTLMIAFSLLGIGYFLTSQMTEYTAVFLSMVVLGLGAGTFKPIISGTIARCTDTTNSTLGFGIFYWSINLGAFLFPLILVPALKSGFGWSFVILASAFFTGMLILPTIFLYKEPPRQDHIELDKTKQLSLLKTIANAFEIIYSPIVLIYTYLNNTIIKRTILFVFLILISLYSIQLYLENGSSSEMYEETPLINNGKKISFIVHRNKLIGTDYMLSDIVERKYGVKKLKFIFIDDSLNDSPYIIKDLTTDNIKVTINNIPKFEKDSESIYMSLYNNINDPAFKPLELKSALQDHKNNQNIKLMIYDPDNYNIYKSDLVNSIKNYKQFNDISQDIIDKHFSRSLTKTSFDIVCESKESKVKYDVKQVNDEYFKDKKYIVTLYNKELSSSDKEELFSSVVKYSDLSMLSLIDLDKMLKNVESRNSILLVVLLIVIAFCILFFINTFKIFVSTKKTLMIFITLGVLLGILWLLPNISTFIRVLLSVIYLTVLSLFTIDTSDKEKFKDHGKFLLMIFLYSGFWVLYFQMFDTVLWYVNAYVDAEELNEGINSVLNIFGVNINWRFDVEIVTVINAGTIILLQLLISNIVKNKKALPTMIFGIFLATIGMGILAISTNIWIFIIGIIMFSIGEMTAHPKFISYIGLTAPKARVAMYMGYLFLYGVIGASIAGITGAKLYVHYVDKLNQPKTLWIIFAGIGVVTIILLLFYNKFFTKKSELENV